MPEPSLVTKITEDLILPTPFIAASGTFGYGDEATDLTNLADFGTLITPTLTLEPRAGNPPPRTAEANSGLLHSTGLPNPGLKAFLSDYLPRLRDLSCPVIVSIYGETKTEWTELAQQLTEAGGIEALELNLCPPQLLFTERFNEPFPSETQSLDLKTACTSARAASDLPLIAKLPPAGLDIGYSLQIAAQAKLDVICVAQAFPAVAVQLNSGKFRFPGVVGALSGPAIKPLALYQVWRATQASTVPVIGGGGITTLDDALEFFLTGATAVTVGLANLIQPKTIPRLASELRAYLAKRSLSDLSTLIGSASR